MDDCPVNDENAFDHVGTSALGKGNDILSNSQRRSIDKNPLKPLNDASRLSGNMKEMTSDKTPQSSPYAVIRHLDSAERWIERNCVVIRDDHLTTVKNAESIMKDLVGTLPIHDIENKWIPEAVEDTGSALPDTNAISTVSDMDELSELLGTLDIKSTASSHTADGTANLASGDGYAALSFEAEMGQMSSDAVMSHRISHVKELDVVAEGDDDDEIQFGKQIVVSSEAQNHPVVVESIEDFPDWLSNKQDEEQTQLPCNENDEDVEDEEISFPSKSAASIPNSKDEIIVGNSECKDGNVEEQSEVNNAAQSLDECVIQDSISRTAFVGDDSNDPFKTQSKVANSPPIKAKGGDKMEHNASFENENPFATKSKVMDYPLCVDGGRDVDTIKMDEVTSASSVDADEPLATQNEIKNYPSKELTEETSKFVIDLKSEDHCVSKNAFINSPVRGTEEEMLLTKNKSISMNSSEKDEENKMAEVEFDLVDPFVTKTKIVNSPMSNSLQDPMEKAAELNTGCLFPTPSEIVDTPIVLNESQTKCVEDDVKRSPLSKEITIVENCTVTKENFDSDNPFAASNKVANSPTRHGNEMEIGDPFLTNNKIMNSPANNEDLAIGSSFANQCKVTNSQEEKGEDLMKKDENNMQENDPFTAKSKVMNSPVKESIEGKKSFAEYKDEEEQFSTPSKVVNSTKNGGEYLATEDTDFGDKSLENKDPFSTKSKIVNSPVMTEDKDPFSTESKIVNSPVMTEDKDPFSTKSKIVNSPVMTEDKDPFSTKSKIVNSPVMTEDKDPFSTKSQIVNSPIMNEDKDPSMNTEIVECRDECLESEDPFTTKHKMMNSPVRNETEAMKIIDATDCESRFQESEDLFSTRCKIIDSPSKNRREDLKAVQETAGCKDGFQESEDPFSTRSKIVNSPERYDSKDPKTVDQENEDPFSTRSKIVNSPKRDEIEDSKTAPEAINGNDECEESEDPFSTRSKIVNSPLKNKNELPFIKDADDSSKSIETDDPFSTSSKTVNSPFKNSIGDDGVHETVDDNIQTTSEVLVEDNPFQTENKVANSPVSDSKENEVQFNSAINETGNKAQPDELESSDEDDDDFKSFENSPVKVPEEENLFNIKSPLVDSPRSQSVVSDLFQAKDKIVTSCNDTGPVENDATIENSLQPSKDTSKASLNIDDLVTAMKLDNLSKEQKTADDSVQNVETNALVDENTFKECEATDLSNGLLESNGETEMNIDTVVHDNSRVTVENPKTSSKGVESGCIDDFVFVKPMPVQQREEQASLVSQASGAQIQVDRQSCVETSSQPDTDEFDDCMFIDATEAFNSANFLDKLEKDFGTKEMARSLNRGSVLLKFDPLAEKRGSPKRPPRVSEIFKGSSAPSDDGVCLFGTPPKKATRRPAVNTRVPGIAKESIEEESPAHEVDMMLNLDTHEVMKEPGNEIFSSTAPRLVELGAIYTEADVTKLKMELTLHYEERLLQKDRDFEKLRLEKEEEHAKIVEEMENQMKTLVEEKEKFSSKADSLKTKLLKNKMLFDDYVHLIKKLSDENKMLESRVNLLTHDGTQAKEDYKRLDKSFADLFHRCEKLKSALVQSAANEATLKTSLEDSHDKYKEKAEAMKKMKESAETKLSEQEDQIEKLNASHKAEAAKLEAVLKRKEMEVRSLKDSLERKKAENAELTELCDSLINKVSGK